VGLEEQERSPERKELTEAVMAERAAEWGLVLKSDSLTGKICGVRTRKLSGDRSSSSTGSGSRRRSSGNWTSEPGTSSTRTSICTSTTSMCTSITSMRTSETSTRSSDASDTGSTNISSMMRSLLPLLPHELKDVLSKFEHAFVVSDATWREFPIIYASAGFFSLTGYSPQEVIGQNWYVGGWVFKGFCALPPTFYHQGFCMCTCKVLTAEFQGSSNQDLTAAE
jgi:non-specific serine/threonine protein kinase